MVDVFIRPLTQTEREIYGSYRLPPGMLQVQKPKRTKSDRGHAKARPKVEKKPRKVPGANSSPRQSRIQTAEIHKGVIDGCTDLDSLN